MAWRMKVRCPSLKTKDNPTGAFSLSGRFDGGTSFGAFKALLWHELGIEQDEGDSNFTILSGFPPRPLTLEDDVTIGTVITNNDALTVQASSSAGDNPQGKGALGKGGRVVKAKAAASKKKKTSPISPSPTVHALQAGGSSGNGRGRGRARGSDGVRGRVGSDAANGGGFPNGIAGVGGSEPNRKRRRRLNLGNSEADVGVSLVEAMQTGGGRSTKGKLFRKAMSIHVGHQYDQSKADARVRAALGGQAVYTDIGDVREYWDELTPGRMKVAFPQGMGSRSKFEEEVEYLGPTVLKTVIDAIHASGSGTEGKGPGRLLLKPHELAASSPRVFWSLVRLYGGDVPTALRTVCPTLDWAFLSARVRELSAKAKENKQVERYIKREDDDDDEGSEVEELEDEGREGGNGQVDKGQGREEGGEGGGGGGGETEASSAAEARRKVAAEAALARLNHPTATTTSTTTGDAACGENGDGGGGGGGSDDRHGVQETEPLGKGKSKAKAKSLALLIGGHGGTAQDLKELTEVVEGEANAKEFVEVARIDSIVKLAAVEDEELPLVARRVSLSVHKVTELVNDAQASLLDRLMEFILAGEVKSSRTAVEEEDDDDSGDGQLQQLMALLERLHVANPRDVELSCRWADIFWQMLKEEAIKAKADGGGGDVTLEGVLGGLSEADVRVWYERAEALCAELPWLENWTYSAVDDEDDRDDGDDVVVIENDHDDDDGDVISP